MSKTGKAIDLLENLNSECFTYENWCANWWTELGLDFEEALDDKQIKRVIRKYAVGYCDSSKVKMRPRENNYAVMFERNGYRFWCHIEQETLNNIK